MGKVAGWRTRHAPLLDNDGYDEGVGWITA